MGRKHNDGLEGGVSQATLNLRGFTLIELLVVIAAIALLLAILIPVTRAARERGQRAVCLSNLRQLTVAWIAYADQHDGRLVNGASFSDSGIPGRPGCRLRSWIGRAFLFPESRASLFENPDKGALWQDIRNVDVYRCPRALPGHAVTYATVVAANNQVARVEGTVQSGTGGYEVAESGVRVGPTALRLTRLTDIVSPGPSQRAVFLDRGQTPVASGEFSVHYLWPRWRVDVPPIHHEGGLTLSMADGHAEYWRWKGHETIRIPRMSFVQFGAAFEMGHGEYEPQTAEGLYDLQRLQRATWGRLGYEMDKAPSKEP